VRTRHKRPVCDLSMGKYSEQENLETQYGFVGARSWGWDIVTA
jgi:hypothetical protein